MARASPFRATLAWMPVLVGRPVSANKPCCKAARSVRPGARLLAMLGSTPMMNACLAVRPSARMGSPTLTSARSGVVVVAPVPELRKVTEPVSPVFGSKTSSL